MHPYTVAADNLKRFMHEPQSLNVVHYACETFYGKQGPTRISAVAVKHPSETKLFSIYRYCLDHDIHDQRSLQADDPPIP